MLGLVNHPNDISLSRANQSQAKFKSAVDRILLQSWVNLTIVVQIERTVSISLVGFLIYFPFGTGWHHGNQVRLMEQIQQAPLTPKGRVVS